MRHFLSLFDVKTDEIERIFQLTDRLKSRLMSGIRDRLFEGRVVGLLFEKPSLRTRVSFEAGVAQLGGSSIYLSQDVGWGQREPAYDFGRVVSQYLDALVGRVRDHAVLEELARYCNCPVINGLSDRAHPCQALADLYTLRGLCDPMAGKIVAFLGDGNNVARSLAVACAHFGVHFVLSSPRQYRFEDAFVRRLKETFSGAQMDLVDDPIEAVANACAVYTDVWASMGQESECGQRRLDFAKYQANAELMAHAPSSAYFMHCLPAHRGEEVTDEVIDGPRSVVIEQAANRMHVEKGILAWLFEAEPPG